MAITTEKMVFPFGQDENFRVTLGLLDIDDEAVQIVAVQTEGQATSAEIDYLQNRVEGELLWNVYRDIEHAVKNIDKVLDRVSQMPVQRRNTPTAVPIAVMPRIVSRKAVPMDEFPTEPDAPIIDEGFPTQRDEPVLAAPVAKKEGVYKCGFCGQLGHNKRTCPNK